MAEVVPKRVEDALAHFKSGPMQEELRLARESALVEFKSVSLPGLLREEFSKGFISFAASDQGEEYIQREWCRGLVEYRDAMIHYNPKVNACEVDRHFPAVFEYAVSEGEVLPEVSEHPFPEPPEDGDDVDSSAQSLPPRID